MVTDVHQRAAVRTTFAERIVIALLLVGFLILVVRNAWLSDDAYITFRTVDNFVNGYGLTWNVRERVQAYTHPLWMFLMAGVYAITGEIFYTSQLVSIALSFVAVLMIALYVSRTSLRAMAALVTFILSKAFVDYATSGLENPLTHLILAAFILIYAIDRASPRRLLWLSLVAALGMVNRLDTLLLFAPALVWAVIEARSRGTPPGWRPVLGVCLGALPLLLWLAFATFYYGTPLPNTALAKLNTGLIERRAIWSEGLRYLENSLRVDPITLVTIAVAVVLPLLRRDWRQLPLMGGILLYILYIVHVGGDFMSGRFLTAPLFQAVALLTMRPVAMGANPVSKFPNWMPSAAWVLAALVMGLSAPYTPLRASGATSADRDPRIWVRGRGITDERANYYANTGLLSSLADPGAYPTHDWARRGRQAREAQRDVVVQGSVGFFGYFAGPDVHVVDLLGLGDPLLGRLPVADPNWQIGHLGRRPPEGYLETLRTGTVQLADPDLARYYGKLTAITQGPLWDVARWRVIWRMAWGRYDAWLDAYAYRREAVLELPLRVVNPTGASFVYAYVWNNGAGETYLLDDASAAGEVYDIRWVLSPADVDFAGTYIHQLSSIGPLSDVETLNVGVFFAEDASLAAYEIFERRFWFRFDRHGRELIVVQPELEFYNEAAPGGFWQEADIDGVLSVVE
ncbi:MAG: hypothetical protein ACP5HG_07845 [Anaerolineae bacterium]